MKRLGVLALALMLAGCGNSEERVKHTRRQAHSLAATSLLVLEAVAQQRVSRRFGAEHVHDARKNLDQLRKGLAQQYSADANALSQQLDHADDILKDLEAHDADDAALARTTPALQQLETSLREPPR
jgi:hypothetical protein